MILATQAAFAGIDLATWKKFWLLLFFFVFLAIVLRLVFARRGHYDADARIPLEDEPVQPRDARSGKKLTEGHSQDG